MAVEKRTTVEQIEIKESGHIQIRFALLLIEDGVVIDSKWHRTAIEPGGDIDAQISAVNTHLAQMGKEAVPADGVVRVKAQAQAAWTPEVLKAHKEKK